MLCDESWSAIVTSCDWHHVARDADLIDVFAQSYYLQNSARFVVSAWRTPLTSFLHKITQHTHCCRLLFCRKRQRLQCLLSNSEYRHNAAASILYVDVIAWLSRKPIA